MGSGDHNNVNNNNNNKKNSTLDFHIHMHHHHHHHHNPHELKKDVKEDIPKGCLAVMVGQGEEELQRFVIPVMNINHPLFLDLLKEAEEVYGFDHEGPINIPCRVEQFRNVQDMIDQEIHSQHHHHHHVHQHHHHHIWCFKA